MKNRALLSALALCFVAAGCDAKKAAEPPPPKAAAAVTPLPPAAPQPPAASANQDAKPVQVAAADTPKTDAPKTGAGGVAPTKGNGRKGCTQGRCKVIIDVTEGATPCAKATPDMVHVFEGNKNDNIMWTIRTPGWEFAANGIAWKDSGQKQFTAGGHNGSKNTFKWKDANTDEKEYKYAIHLVNGKKKCDADPSAVNGATEQSQQDGGG